MTPDDAPSVHDDIAYVRNLAEQGRRTPMLGGRILIAAGLVFGLAALAHWVVALGVLAVPPVALAFIWMGAMAIFFLSLIFLIGDKKARPGAGSMVNQATGAAWMGVGLMIFVMVLSIGVVSWRVGDPVLTLIFPSLIFAAYGSGWAVSAAMTKARWQWRLALGSWVAAPAIAALTGSTWIWPAYALGLVLLALVPGVILVRQEPKAPA